ncbi:MAG TPA: hypothetical protein VFB59_02915, partial [Candidatus Saccharimonadales bacterium]|nr:hypothetical protein [Candidatus Saccharimonadales bacterium]
MQNKNQNTNVVFPATDANDASGVAGFAQSNLSQPLSLDQPINTPQSPYTQQVVPVAKQEKLFVRLAKRADVILAVLLILGSGGLVLSSSVGKEPTSQSVASRFETTQLPLSEFVATSEGLTFGTQSVIINGSLQVKDGLIIAPTVQPTTAVAGQMYYDQTSNILSYYNGSEFVSLSAASGVQSLGGVSGSITVGDGLSVTAGQLANTGVLTVQGQTGNVTFTGGNGIAINGTTI